MREERPKRSVEYSRIDPPSSGIVHPNKEDVVNTLEGRDIMLRDLERLEGKKLNKKLNMTWQCVFAAQEASCVPGCIKSMTSRLR